MSTQLASESEALAEEALSLAEKTAQAVRIRKNIVRLTTDGFKKLGTFDKERREEGIAELERALRYEKTFNRTIHKGAREGIRIANRILHVMPQLHFKAHAIQKVKTLRELYKHILEEYGRVLHKRTALEKKLIVSAGEDFKWWHAHKSLGHFLTHQRVQSVWRKERALDAKVYRMIDEQTIKNEEEAFLQIRSWIGKSSQFAKKHGWGAFYDNTVAAMVVANPAVVALFMSPLSTQEKLLLAFPLWQIAGAIARLLSIPLQIKKMLAVEYVDQSVYGKI